MEKKVLNMSLRYYHETNNVNKRYIKLKERERERELIETLEANEWTDKQWNTAPGESNNIGETQFEAVG